MDARVLARLFDFVRERRVPIRSLLIVRNGTIVLDASFFPYRSGDPHDLASATKSVTSTLIGIAIGERLLGGVDQAVLPLFPRRRVANRGARKEHLTIEHLLTMTSGLDCRFRPGEITLGQMQHSPDWIQFMLDLPMAADPGSRFEYCSGGMHLLSGIVAQAAGTSPLEYARRRLFEPLGIDSVIWPADPLGTSHGWGDLHLAPRDAAKISAISGCTTGGGRTARSFRPSGCGRPPSLTPTRTSAAASTGTASGCIPTGIRSSSRRSAAEVSASASCPRRTW